MVHTGLPTFTKGKNLVSRSLLYSCCCRVSCWFSGWNISSFPFFLMCKLRLFLVPWLIDCNGRCFLCLLTIFYFLFRSLHGFSRWCSFLSVCVCVDFRFFDGGIFLFVVSCFCSRHSNIHTHHFLVYVWLCSYMCVSCVVTLVLLDKKNCCRFSFFYWISSKLPTQKQNDSNGNNILFRQLSCCFQIEKK